MKRLSILAAGPLFVLTTACSVSGSGALFDGKDSNKWKMIGSASVQDDIIILKGTDALAVLKNGKYKNFDLTLDLRATPGGKGAVWLHTDLILKKEYCIAINNDRVDRVWWKMTGSLVSVRNLTKSLVKEDQWLKMDTRVVGQKIDVNINGEPVAKYIQLTALCRTDVNAYALLSEGTFVIESDSSGEIQIKNITVNVADESMIDTNTQLAEASDEQNDEIIKLHQSDFPILDYHMYLKDGLTKEAAAKQSRETGINYMIAPGCGIGFPITNDQQVTDYLNKMRSQPFILGMQVEGHERITIFSPETLKEFDRVFTDASTLKDNEGRHIRPWTLEETRIENEEQYMDMIADRIRSVSEELADIYVNSCFLPSSMDKCFDEFRTEARINRFVEALAKSGEALEINELYNISNRAVIMKAEAAGVKSTFGSNNVTPNVSDLSYSIRMMKECGPTAEDMYRPKVKI